jgi:hypothetical protein
MFKYKAFNISLKALFVYLLAILIFETGLWQSQQYPSLFTLLEYLCIYTLFYFETTNKLIRGYFRIFAAFFIIFTGVELVMCPHEDYLLMLDYLLVIVLALLFFYQLLSNLTVERLKDYPFFYFNTAFLIYFCGSFFIFLFSKQVSTLDKDLIKMISMFHCLLNIFYLSFITIGIWKVSRK